MASDKERSYRNTALIALSSLANIFLSVIRNKVFSIFLGPVGIGQFGILNDFVNAVFTIGSFGVGNSGVQAISEAAGKGPIEVRKVYKGLNRIFLSVGVLIVLGIVVFANQISQALVDDQSFALFLRISAIAILIRFHSALYTVLVTGLQRMGVVARTMIIQGLVTTIMGIVLVYFLRQQAVPFLILSIWVATWVVSFWYTRRIEHEIPQSDKAASFKELWPVLLVGISSLWAGFLESAVALINKSWISKEFGKEYLGYYQVAVGFTGSYIGFITTSIITQYYPRLISKILDGNSVVNEYVNQQLTISMTLIMPILLVILTFSKLFISVFFTDKFMVADELLSYTVSGTLILVVAWPIAFVFLAHRSTTTYILSETVGNGSMLLLGYLAIRSGEFNHLGLAYVLHYVIYIILITFLFYRRFGGEISRSNYVLFLFNVLIILAVFISKKFLGDLASYGIGILLILVYLYRSRSEYLYMFKSIVKRT